MKLNIDFIYPVGSIYMSTNSTNPNILFGGSWEQIKDTFLLACGNTYANGSTGGEATHKLTTSEMPNHHHKMQIRFNASLGGHFGDPPGIAFTEQPLTPGGDTTDTGGDQPHNNMPPYLAVYVWKRTA